MKPPENHQVSPSLCWNCHTELESPYRCDNCIKIQPWPDGVDRFAFLGLPRRLQVDVDDLEERFLKLSKIFHPDYYQGSDEKQREIALINASRLNRAYHTLKDPTLRAAYILELELGSQYKPTKTVQPELAAEIMELQEILAEYNTLEDGSAARAEASSELAGRLKTLQKMFSQNDDDLDLYFNQYDQLKDSATSPLEPAVREKVEKVLKHIDLTLATRLYLKRAIDNITAVLEGQDVSPL